MVEHSLLTPEIRSSNPANGKTLFTNCEFKIDKNENNEKEAMNGPAIRKKLI